MDKDQRVRNMLILVLLFVPISTCSWKREAHAREFDLQCTIGRDMGNMNSNNSSSELYFSLSRLSYKKDQDDHDVGMATCNTWAQSLFDKGEQFPCNSSVGNDQIAPLIRGDFPDIEKALGLFFDFDPRPNTGHISTANLLANTSQSVCEKSLGQERKSESNISQWDISDFINSRWNIVEKVNGGETTLFRPEAEPQSEGIPSNLLKHSLQTPNSLTDEKYMNMSVCFLGALNKDIIPQRKFQTPKLHLDLNDENQPEIFSHGNDVCHGKIDTVYRKPNGNFSNIETTKLNTAIGGYPLAAYSLNNMPFTVDQFENISDSVFHHPHDEVIVLHLPMTKEKDMHHVTQNRSTQMHMCDLEETQYNQGQIMLQHNISKYHTNLENQSAEKTSKILRKMRMPEFQGGNEGIEVQPSTELSESNEQHSSRSSKKESPNITQNCLSDYILVNLTMQCTPSYQVLENEDISETGRPTTNINQIMDECCEPTLPLHFSLDPCWNITVKSPEYKFKPHRDLSYSENSDSLTSLFHIKASGKRNKSKIVECPIYNLRSSHITADTYQAYEAPTEPEFPVEGEESSSLCFPYTSGNQSKSMLVHEKSSSSPGTNDRLIGYVCKNPTIYGYSLPNSIGLCPNSRQTHGLSPMRRKGRPHQVDFRKFISADENVDMIQYGNTITEDKIIERKGEADYEILNVITGDVETYVQMAWPLMVLMYSCSLLVIIWSMYGAAHLYKFYIEQRRMLSPRTPTSSYHSPGFPFRSDSMQAIVNNIKGDQVASTNGGICLTTPNCSPIKQPRCSTSKPLREKFQQLLHSDLCLGDRVELYAADNIRSMVRYDPGLGMKLWPHFKHNTRRYVGRTVHDRKITQYVEKKLQSRMLTDFAFQEDIFCYIEKHVWPEVRSQAQMSIGDWQDSRLDFRSREVMRGEALTYLSARFSTILWHDGLLEREIMSHVEQTRHGSMHHIH